MVTVDFQPGCFRAATKTRPNSQLHQGKQSDNSPTVSNIYSVHTGLIQVNSLLLLPVCIVMNNKYSLTLLILGLSFISACQQAEPPAAEPVVQPVKVIEISAGDGAVKRDLPATVRASQRANLSFQVPGKLVELPVKDGQEVTKGQLLARLDEADYRISLNAAEAQLNSAKANFERAEELIEKDYVSRSDYDKLKAAFDIASSDYEKAAKALRDTRMKAPFDGAVARVIVDNFQEVQAKQDILSLQNNKLLEVVVNIPENLVLRSKGDANVELNASLEGIPDKKFPLSVKEFSTDADPETRTYQYVLTIDDTFGENILPGMTAMVNARRTDLAVTGRTVIPLSALVAGEDSDKRVWTVGADNKVSTSVVTTGNLVGSDSIAVLSGLNAGDRVVVAGISALIEGMKVKPVETISF